MADVSSLYPAPPQQPQNALAGNPLSIIDMMGKLNQNALFQQEFAAKRAVGQAYQKAIDPKTGVIDTPTLMREIQSHPDAGFLAGEASQGALARQGQAISNATGAFKLAQDQNNAIRDTFGSLANKPNLSKEDLYNAVVMLGRNTNIPTATLTNYIRSVPNDPKAIRDFALSLQAQSIGATGTATRITGPPTQSGAATTLPLGAGMFSGGQGAPAGPGGPNLQPSAPSLPGQIQTEPPPGLVEGARAVATESGGMLAHHYAQSADYNRQVFPLETAIDALKTLGAQGTGPGTETVNHLKSFLLSMGTPGIDADKIKTFDEAKKYLTDFVNQTGNSGTNDKLAAAFAGNPSVNISNAAAIDVAKAALALRRMQEARVRAFASSGLPEKDYAKFSSQFNARTDPRVYGFDYLDAPQRRAVLNSIKSQSKRDEFMMDVEDAERSGLLRSPHLMPPPVKK